MSVRLLLKVSLIVTGLLAFSVEDTWIIIMPVWVPQHLILDMDRGTLAFQIDNDFLGVAFSGLRGEELFPIVSAVWGHCEVTLTYIGNHFFDGDRSDA